MTQNIENNFNLQFIDPIVMGIINVTPDSFYANSRVVTDDILVAKATKMIQEGASILDIGGQSTRPESTFLSVDEELERVIPAIKLLRKHFPNIPLSVDTFYSIVAKEAILAGANMINDISGGQLDADMIPTVGALQVPYICMHTRGTPQNMIEKVDYENVLQSLHDYFTAKIEECVKANVKQLILDVGFGFAKTPMQNLLLLKKMKTFTSLGYPLLIGVSRKSTIYKLLNTDADGALNGTSILHTIALMNGAKVLRVHDVKEAMECITLVKEYEMAMG